MRYVTEELPGTGGRLKVEASDFRVTEIPLYPPSGQGHHIWLHVEKEGIGSLEAADRIARALGQPGYRVGLAGLKDAHAVTRQWMSLDGVDAEKASRLHLENVKILSVSRHRNKLKIGHLAGNRFEVRIRGCAPASTPGGATGAKERAERILKALEARGVANWFDRQRFGTRGDNHLLGRSLVLGEAKAFCDRFLGGPGANDSPRLAEARRLYDAGRLAEAEKRFAGCPDQLRVLRVLARTGDPGRAMRALAKRLARLLVGATQADLFNRVLERRFGSIDTVEAGDLAYLHHCGAVFLVDRPEVEAPRAARLEISPSGPIVGHRVTLAQGRPGEIERTVLAESGIGPEDFERVKALRLRGGRRPLRVPLTKVAVEEAETDLVVRFTLPPGAYATIVMAEITKTETGGGA